MASKKELKQYLQNLSQAELVKEIEKLYTRFKNVQEYYTAELGGDTSKLVLEYKKKLDKVFAMRGMTLNPSMAETNKIIKEFSKISVHIVDVIDVMIYKAELCVELFNNWGFDGFDSVVNSFLKTYDSAIDLINENNVEDHFMQRCKKIEAYASQYFLINNTIGNG